MTQAPVAPWIAAQAAQLLAQRGHAWLLAGPSGLGQYELALSLVRAWLCERPTAAGACGTCGSCHAIDVRTHADLCVLMPETHLLEFGWPLSEKAQSELDDKKRKPSKEIRVDAMRDALEFAQRTSARGRSKAILIFPADRMNAVSSNALLKTLEEPAGDLKFVLASEAAHELLPTIRSRCLAHAMWWPRTPDALTWLEGGGLTTDQARTMLGAAGGRPQDALRLAASGVAAQDWVGLPAALARGDISVLKDWAPTQVLDAMHKLCHDMLAVAVGAGPRFFAGADLPPAGRVERLTAWSKALGMAARDIEHPWNGGLLLETLVSQAQLALNSGHQA